MLSSALYIGVTFAIFKSSGKIPFSRDKSKRNFNGSDNSPKHFLITLKLISSYPGFLLIFSEKNASFSSLIDNGSEFILEVIGFINTWKFVCVSGILFAKFIPIFVKKLLNSVAIFLLSKISLVWTIIFFGRFVE